MWDLIVKAFTTPHYLQTGIDKVILFLTLMTLILSAYGLFMGGCLYIDKRKRKK